MSLDDSIGMQSAKVRKCMIAGVILLSLFIVWPVLAIQTIVGQLYLKGRWIWYGLWLGFGVAGVVCIALGRRTKAAILLSGTVCFIFGFIGFLAVQYFYFEYARFQQAEGKVGLAGIYINARVNKEERKTYEVSRIGQLGYAVIGETHRYSFWYAVNGVPTRIPLPVGSRYKQGSCDVLTPPTSVEVTASATAFTAATKGNLEGHGHVGCDEWSINEKKELVHTLDDARD